MKKTLPTFRKLTLLLLVFNFINSFSVYSQNSNVGFESCDFTGWTGTYSGPDNTPVPCAPGTGPGNPIPCVPGTPNTSNSYPDPFRFKGMRVGSVNQASNRTPENSHFIMNSGYDSVVGGAKLPVVCPWSGTCSARLGNAQANGGGESMSYKFIVDGNNPVFTYNYAAVFSSALHASGQQPYFKVKMYSYNSSSDSTIIDTATFDLDENTAAGIGGFISENGLSWKSWSSISIPLDDYIGKTVSIQFITRDCCPDCDSTGHGTTGGSHYAYVYLDAGLSSGSICNPPASPVALNKTICSGDSAYLSATGLGNLTWYSASGYYLGSGTNFITPALTYDTKYYVQDSTCSVSFRRTAVNVTIAHPSVTANANPVKVCIGNSIVLSGSGAVSYSWTGGVMDGVGFYPTISTDFTVTGTDANNCVSSYTVNVVVDTLPIVIASASLNSVCPGTAVILRGSGIASYTWSHGVMDGLSFVPTSTNTYTLTGTNSDNCSNTSEITIFVKPLPDISTSLNGNKIIANQIGAIYRWLDCDNNFTPISGEVNRSFIPSVKGNYALALNLNGCKDTSACIADTINCYSHFTTAYDTTQNAFTLTVDSITSAFANSYQWNFGDGSTSTLATPSHVYAVDTVYNVCLKIKTAFNNSCMYCHKIGKDYLGNIYRTAGFTVNVVNSNLNTGETELSNENSFVVYPNPTAGILNLQMDKVENLQIQISNVLGECIYQNNITSSNIQIDLSVQPNGIYTLQLKTAKGIVNKKVVVSH